MGLVLNDIFSGLVFVCCRLSLCAKKFVVVLLEKRFLGNSKMNVIKKVHFNRAGWQKPD